MIDQKDKAGDMFLHTTGLCFIWTGYRLYKPPPSTKSQPLLWDGQRDLCGRHWLQVSLGARGKSECHDSGVREVQVVPLVSWLSIKIYFIEMLGPSLHIPCASQAGKGQEQGQRKRAGSSFYLMKFPPPISLLYLLVRWSACSVSLDRTPNSPRR